MNNLDLVCKLPTHYHAGIILCVALFEAWLGKTDKVKASSIVDLLLRCALWPFKKIFHKGGDDEKHR